MPVNVFLSHVPAKHYLRDWREKRGLSQEQLGKLCRTTGATISRYEKGERGLPLELQLKLFDVLDILPGQFFAPPDAPSLDAYASFLTVHELGHLLATVKDATALEPEERLALLVGIRERASGAVAAKKKSELSPQSPQSTPEDTV